MFFIVVAVNSDDNGNEILSTSSSCSSFKQVLNKGDEGELFIGGIGVTRGYIHASELTEKVFIPNPFGDGMVYRTGDLVKELDDGNFVFIRRLDDQVKVNGFRIELSEIEMVLMSHPIVDKAVVLIRNEQICAYIRLKKGAETFTVSDVGIQQQKQSNQKQHVKLIQDIKTHVARSLTHYMMPRHYVVVESFPVGNTGKTDKKALPDPPKEQLLQEVEEEDN
eukprot:gene13707-29145_t